MKSSIAKARLLAVSVSMLLGTIVPAFAQTDAPPASNQGPDGLDKTGEAIVGNGDDLGPNENSLGNAIEILCPRLLARVPRPQAATPEPDRAPDDRDDTTDNNDNNGNNGNNGQNLQARLQQTGDPRSPQEVDLQRRCTEVVQFRSRTSGTGDQFTDLSTILRELNIDEAAAQNRGLVELATISTSTVIGRLEQLRLADAGNHERAVVSRSGPGRWGYHLETGGAAGDADFGRWSIYLNGELSSAERDQTTLEAGFDVDGGRITAGADYRVNDNTFVGGSLGYLVSDTNFDNGSNLDTDGIDVMLYGTTYTDNGLYFQGTAGLGFNDYTQDRRFRYTIPAVPPPAGSGGAATTVDQTARSNTDGHQLHLSVGMGKDIDAGNGILANFTASLNYLDASIDGFTETISNNAPGLGMGLRVRDQDIESLRSSLGGQVSKAISTKNGVVIPFGRADWVHEFKNDARTIIASFANDTLFGTTTTFGLRTEEPDANYFRFGGGASAVFTGGLQGFIAVDTVLGLSDLSYYTVTAGIRKEL